jgi:LuxR family transcriptional regulator/LuxR family quorum-sensing system transcriptional regulator CciR
MPTEITPPENYNAIAEHFVMQINQANTFEKVLTLCMDFYAQNGIAMACYHHIPPFGAYDERHLIGVIESGFPEHWKKKYIDEKLYEIDPIPDHTLTSLEPFWWLDIDKKTELSADGKKYMDILRSSNIGDGLAIPVFGPNGRNGSVSIGLGKYDLSISPLYLSRLQTVAQISHQKYCILLSATPEQKITFSEREIEILKWILHGKSNSVIADIIGISAHTVDTYLKRIYGKLGVSNRITAALRGVSLGAVW